WAGGPVTLALPVFHGPVALEAGGRRVPGSGLGLAHAWRIDDAARDGGDVPLRLDLDGRLTPYLSAAPRLSATEGRDAGFALVRDFNFGAAVVAVSLGALFSLLCLVVFALDRGRREYAWAAVTLASAAVMFLAAAWPPTAILPWVAAIVVSASTLG